ncbi:MAG TPA: alanine--tRNA ligase [Ignavibacteria bacterium]|nr:alanine--tRNA ligase [Ignavibacteria bacterium]
MNSSEIRQSFLDFFKEREHKIVPSAPTVPFEDPTLLFTNAGMNQFKDVFLGTGTRDYTRAADTQKCIRAGGKHNDLEDVGRDGTHHTFFEMLGNWSFGDYYKKEAITWAWELLTKKWKLDKNRLWVTVYRDDDEAYNLWKTETDIDHSHILRFDEKDNFWEMGETGPCGPCSEIHYDFTEMGCKPEDVNAGIDDVMEIWNLVFIQYNRNEKGELEPLPKKHIDTGMGFERMVRVMQNKKSNYDTDVFEEIIKKICEISGKKHEGENISAINAIADHIRTLVFAISDGAIPSNEGRGYVLRRILRRASRLARKLDLKEPFLYKLIDVVVEKNGKVFPEIVDKKDYVSKIIKAEEESFNVTLDKGIELFNNVYEKIKNNKDKIFPGEDAFKLYDTYGFPLDLTEVIAEEKGFKVDTNIFNSEMENQKERARSARKSELVLAEDGDDSLNELIAGKNIIYNPYDLSPKGIATEILSVKRIPSSDIDLIVLKENPFYSESGGQISDTGKLIFNGSELEVIDSKNKYFIYVKDYDGNRIIDKNPKAIIDLERRLAIQRNHSATHIVHEVLKRVLGSHIKQMGSLVSDEYLRFDFPHFQKVTDDELRRIEDEVNDKIFQNILVNTLVDIPIEEANEIPNVKKFFGEKYGEKVRVVIIDENFSVEFCGGTHVKKTDEIGLFKITKEESISSGVRRIFAATGEGTKKWLNEQNEKVKAIYTAWPEPFKKNIPENLSVDKIADKINKTSYDDGKALKDASKTLDEALEIYNKVNDEYLESKKKEEKENLKKNLSVIFEKIKNEIDSAKSINDVKYLISEEKIYSKDELKEISDFVNSNFKDGVAFMILNQDDKVNLLLYVGDIVSSNHGLNAGKLVGEYAKKFGGGGGGKANVATAGLKDASKVEEVKNGFEEFLKEKLK